MTQTQLDQAKLTGDLGEPKSETQVKPRFPQNIRDLQAAMEVFTHSKKVTKGDDVILDGARVGVVYRDQLGQKYLLLFKREAYFMFSRHFNVPEKGHGIPCNMKLVHWCYMNDVLITVIMGNGYCYTITGKQFWDYYEKYNTELPHAPGEIAAPFSFFTREF